MTNIPELELSTIEDADGNIVGWIKPLSTWWVVISGDKELDEARCEDACLRKLDADMAAQKALGWLISIPT